MDARVPTRRLGLFFLVFFPVSTQQCFLTQSQLQGEAVCPSLEKVLPRTTMSRFSKCSIKASVSAEVTPQKEEAGLDSPPLSDKQAFATIATSSFPETTGAKTI